MTDNIKQKRHRTRKWWIPALFAFPVLCVALSGENEFAGRLIASIFFICILISFAIWATIAPYQKLMGNRAKLCLPHYEKARKIILPVLRSLFGGLALMIIVYHLIPLTIDVSLLMKGEKPLTVVGTVTTTVSPFPLLEFISQEILLEHDGHINSYRFYYSLRPRLRSGSRYELLYIKHSKVVLEAKKLPLLLKDSSESQSQ